MDIVWEREKYFNATLKDCKKGAVVQLKKYPGFGPFLVIGRDHNGSVGKILLFNLSENRPTFFDTDEHVEVLQAELHVL